jgi:serine/threonine protein kinase
MARENTPLDLSADNLLTIGFVIADQYRVASDILARGGSSYVKKAHDEYRQDKECIVKFCLVNDLFERELNIMKRLKHQNIVELYEALESDGDSEWYPHQLIIMECGWCTLDTFVNLQRPIVLNQAKSIINDIISALEACEEQQIGTNH